jgi:hypothetical protein
MVAQYSSDFLECIATGMSKFVPQPIPELSSRKPTIEALVQLGMVETLFVKLRPGKGRALRHALRRLHSAGSSYTEMRASLIKYGHNFKGDSPNFVAYFSALDAAENCIVHFHVALESIKYLWAPEEGILGNVPEKVDSIANSFKHSGGQAKSQAQSGRSSLFPVFFVDVGISNGREYLSFNELHSAHETVTDFVSGVADGLAKANPLDPIMTFKYKDP